MCRSLEVMLQVYIIRTVYLQNQLGHQLGTIQGDLKIKGAVLKSLEN